MNMGKLDGQVAARVIAVIGIINFLAFFVTAIAIGGDAINGKSESGHFYLANHGKLTEVSERVFRYSRLHAISLWITHPAAMGAGLWMQVYKKRKP